MATSAIPFATKLVSVASNSDAATYSSGNLGQTNGALLLGFATAWRAAGVANTPTASGTNGVNGTWTQIATVAVGSLRMTAFYSYATSGTTGAVTADYGAETETAHVWEVWQCLVGPAKAASPIIQSGTNTNQTATTTFNTCSPALSALGGAFNFVLGCMAYNNGAGSLTNGANYARLDLVSASDGITQALECGVALQPGFSFGSSSADKVGIAIEIGQDGTGGGIPKVLTPGEIVLA